MSPFCLYLHNINKIRFNEVMLMYYCPYYYPRQVAYDYMPPDAAAIIKGGPLAPGIEGVVTFKDAPGGTYVCADISGLPPYQAATDGNSQIGPHGFHIHENGNCNAGDPSNPFTAAGEHWNPTNQPHDNHINRGIAKLALPNICPSQIFINKCSAETCLNVFLLRVTHV